MIAVGPKIPSRVGAEKDYLLGIETLNDSSYHPFNFRKRLFFPDFIHENPSSPW